MVLDVKIDQVIAEKIKVKHQSVFLGTPCTKERVKQITVKLGKSHKMIQSENVSKIVDFQDFHVIEMSRLMRAY